MMAKVPDDRPQTAMNVVTEIEAIQSGALYGHAGLVDGILGRLIDEVGEAAAVVATGGLAPTIVPYCRNVEVVDDYLTLDGLRMIFDRNQDDE